MSIFKDKVLMITGGTGSFGNTVLKHFLETDIKEIRLINTEDIKNITGLDTIELDTTIENVDWLYTEKTVIGSTSSNNLPLCIGKHDELEAGKLSEVETEDLLPVRPVITISKDYIRS